MNRQRKLLLELRVAQRVPSPRSDGVVLVAILLALLVTGFSVEQVWHVMSAPMVLYVVLRGRGDGR